MRVGGKALLKHSLQSCDDSEPCVGFVPEAYVSLKFSRNIILLTISCFSKNLVSCFFNTLKRPFSHFFVLRVSYYRVFVVPTKVALQICFLLPLPLVVKIKHLPLFLVASLFAHCACFLSGWDSHDVEKLKPIYGEILIFSAKLSFVYPKICGWLFGTILDLKLFFFLSWIRMKLIYSVSPTVS